MNFVEIIESFIFSTAQNYGARHRRAIDNAFCLRRHLNCVSSFPILCIYNFIHLLISAKIEHLSNATHLTY